jgi:FMN phosphatase YigB (HAD superfamily)
MEDTTRMKILRVGCDLDGVVYPYPDALRRWVHQHTGKPLDEMPAAQRWEFYLDWGLELDEYLALHHSGILAGRVFVDGEPYPGAVAALTRLHAAGHEVHIVTDRSVASENDPCRAAAEGWLAQFGIPYTSLTISADKTVAGPMDVFIEDRPQNYDALEAAGMNPYLLHRPWNAEHPGRRVRDWAEFVAVVDNLAAA